MAKPRIIRNSAPITDSRYYTWIEDVKSRFHGAQVKAAIRVNTEMLQFYWALGRDIVTMKAEQAWGTGVLQQISLDLRNAFPEQKGFSYTNVKLMSQWYRFYNQNDTIRQQLVGELGSNRQQLGGDLEMPAIFGKVPWGQHIDIIAKCKTVEEALFYVEEVVKNNWSRSMLEAKMKDGLYKATGKAITNFDSKLPADFKPKATAILKDPYIFDFINLKEEYDEHDLEEVLVKNITRFLLELGTGFSYVGRQMELRMPDGSSFFPDLLFYHYRIKSFVVCELKAKKFKPEYAGKLNFYVKAVDELLKGPDDNPTIGLLICGSKDQTTVEWSLSDIAKPLGVATYELEKALSASLRAIEDSSNYKPDAEEDNDE